MEIYREVCGALERLYERSSDTTGNDISPLRSNTSTSADATLTLSPADANYQVVNTNFVIKSIL